MTDADFRTVLEWFGLSWRGYRRVRQGAKKRLTRHMRQLGCATIDQYLKALAHDPGAGLVAEQQLSVSISRFFRDRPLWDMLERAILPELTALQTPSIRVWSAGCACGEELYSFKILWEQALQHGGRAPCLELLGTDLNPVVLERAKQGLYPLSSLKEVPDELRAGYFRTDAAASAAAILPAMREGVSWMLHDLRAGPPHGWSFELIFLRNNLLTYWKLETRREAFVRVVKSLVGGGFLVIGRDERLPAPAEDYPLMMIDLNIFQKW
jgi:chemotaxis methyl-accepting protein methylase